MYMQRYVKKALAKVPRLPCSLTSNHVHDPFAIVRSMESFASFNCPNARWPYIQYTSFSCFPSPPPLSFSSVFCDLCLQHRLSSTYVEILLTPMDQINLISCIKLPSLQTMTFHPHKEGLRALFLNTENEIPESQTQDIEKINEFSHHRVYHPFSRP